MTVFKKRHVDGISTLPSLAIVVEQHSDQAAREAGEAW